MFYSLRPKEHSTPGLPVHHQRLELAQIHIHHVGDAIQPSHPLSSPSPPAFNLPQNQGLFQWVSSSHQAVEYWSFSFSISPSNEYSGFISSRIDWFDLLAVQRTLRSLHHQSLKASILQCSILFKVQLSHPYMTTGKTIALTRWTFVSKVMSLLFNTHSTFVIAFLSRSNLITWLLLSTPFYRGEHRGLQRSNNSLRVMKLLVNLQNQVGYTFSILEGVETE